MRSEVVTLICKSPQKSFQFDLKGIGRINIAPSCTLNILYIIRIL